MSLNNKRKLQSGAAEKPQYSERSKRLMRRHRIRALSEHNERLPSANATAKTKKSRRTTVGSKSSEKKKPAKKRARVQVAPVSPEREADDEDCLATQAVEEPSDEVNFDAKLTAAPELTMPTSSYGMRTRSSRSKKRTSIDLCASPVAAVVSPYKPPSEPALPNGWYVLADELDDLDEHTALMCEQELFYRPQHSWVQNHPALRPSMRAILLDWLRECSEGFSLNRTTYQTAVSIFDRFMSLRKNVPRDRVQLIGAAVLLIAGKLEESYRTPHVSTLLYYCDGLYDREQLLSVEALILRVLEWRVAAPTPHVFAKHIMTRRWLVSNYSLNETPTNYGVLRPRFAHKGGDDEQKWVALAMQILDTARLDFRSMEFRESVLAIASLACARLAMEDEVTTMKDSIAYVLQSFCPRSPETTDMPPPPPPPRKSSAAAQVLVRDTPALMTEPRPALEDLCMQCAAWMQHYMNDISEAKFCEGQAAERQDWVAGCVDKVRVTLRTLTV